MDYNKLDLDQFVKVENDGIIPKTKRKAFGITITSLCFAIGIFGATIFYDRNHPKDTISVQNIKGNEFNDNFSSLDSEYEIVVLKKFVMDNGDWFYQGLIFTSPYQIPMDNPAESYAIIGGSKVAGDKLVVYEKQTRDVSYTDDGNYSIDSDWKITGEYIIANPLKKGYLPPIGDIATRYIYLGTNDKHIHINAQLSTDENGNLHIIDTVSENSANSVDYTDFVVKCK